MIRFNAIKKFAVGLIPAMLLLPAANSFADGHSKQYKEAPMLAKKVTEGSLPSVDKRLPENPKVIPVYEAIGKYGGELKLFYKGSGTSDKWGVEKFLGHAKPVTWYLNKQGTVDIVNNWSENVEVNDMGNEFTFHIRKGMKWSDGVPVTTKDVQFWYDVVSYEESTPGIGRNLFQNDKLADLEIHDDYAFTLKFPKPYPFFLSTVAKDSSGGPGLDRSGFLLPSHYLKQYHPKFADKDALAKILKEKGVQKWTELWHYGPVQLYLLNPELPVLLPLVLVDPPGPNGRVVFERNPYFFGVDEQGNQLPYVDRVIFQMYEDVESLPLAVAKGAVDFQARHTKVADYTFYKENEAKGNYKTITWMTASTHSLIPNQAVKDPVLRKLFQNAKFRQALSVAIDREEINEIAFLGLGEARQSSPVNGSPFYDAEFETKWAEFDPDTANQLLDELGLSKMNDDGIRLRPDGKPLQLILTYQSDGLSDMLELISLNYKEVGIDLQLRLVERSLYQNQVADGNIEIGVWTVDRNAIPTADPRWYLGIHNSPVEWSTQFGIWFASNGKDGEKPAEGHPLYTLKTLWDEAASQGSAEKANTIFRKMVDLHKEAPFVIGVVGELPQVVIVDRDLGNVIPQRMVYDDVLRGVGLAMPHQLYYKN